MASVLLAVCGTTPQLLTETLYALYHENNLPQHVVVLTTYTGRQACLDTLFGKGQMLARFFAEYQIPTADCHFTEQDILVASQDGYPIDDITSMEESALFQDFCIRQACLLTRDTNCRVDFSLAGGRKTMGASLLLRLSVMLAREIVYSMCWCHLPLSCFPIFSIQLKQIICYCVVSPCHH
jgi:CRISPR-associated protein (TIGR02584 family)